MVRIINQISFLFLCQSSDWQCVIEAEDEETAATVAIESVMALEDKNLNMSMFIAVKQINNNLFQEQPDSETKLFYSPIILANAGFYNEANFLNKKLKTDIDYKDEN
jgi:hypothetical protein